MLSVQLCTSLTIPSSPCVTEPLTAALLDIYYQTGFSDSRCLTSLVCFVFIFETIQTILLTHDTFHKLAISFGDYQGLLNPYYIWFDLPVQSAIRMCSIPSSVALLTSAAIVSSITQCFYAWRIKVLSNSRIVALSIVVVCIGLYSIYHSTHFDAVVNLAMCRRDLRRCCMLQIQKYICRSPP